MSFKLVSFEKRRDAYLAEARDADKRAEAATDPATKESWRRIAESYRKLARSP
jgi:hypothetical protein